jgi:ATP-binding cassette, subfamily B, bacterial
VRRQPVVLQATTSDCGPAALAMVLAACGRPVPAAVLRSQLDPGRSGVTALDLRDGGRPFGVRGRGFRLDADEVARLPFPVIAQWRGRHFIVVDGASRRGVSIRDPAVGRRRLGWAQFREGFAGVVLTFETEGPPPVRIAPEVPLWRRMLVPTLLTHRRPLAAAGLLSLMLTALGLAVPVATERVVASITQGRPLGAGAALSVAALAAAAAVLALGRGLVLARLQCSLGRDLAGHAVRHLLRAPYRFFEQRGTGELVSRLSSTDVVRQVLGVQLFTAVLDGLLALGYVVIALCLDPVLGLVAAALAALQLGPLAWLSARTAQLEREELVADAQVTSSLVEAVSGIATVKAAGLETTMVRRWQVLYERRLDAGLRRGRVVAWSEALAVAVRAAAPVLLLLIAGSRALAGELAPGRALGVAALASASLVPVGALADHIRTAHFLGTLLHHLSDVMDARPEQPGTGQPAGRLRGEVELVDVGFRYDGRGPWAVRGVNLHIEPGQKVAIVGRSGSGKSTLAKLLVGLYRPDEGSVLIDGHDLADLDLASVRRQLGVVLQEPFLFAGTIRDNIALGRPDASPQDVVAAARLAAVHDEIVSLPLGYDTVLAQDGTGLSGGQRQRLALARALLIDPATLLLDEATSHLDVRTEAVIEANLRQLSMTRVVIAHRLSTVRDADLVIVMDGGTILARGRADEILPELDGTASSPQPTGVG